METFIIEEEENNDGLKERGRLWETVQKRKLKLNSTDQRTRVVAPAVGRMIEKE